MFESKIHGFKMTSYQAQDVKPGSPKCRNIEYPGSQDADISGILAFPKTDVLRGARCQATNKVVTNEAASDETGNDHRSSGSGKTLVVGMTAVQALREAGIRESGPKRTMDVRLRAGGPCVKRAMDVRLRVSGPCVHTGSFGERA